MDLPLPPVADPEKLKAVLSKIPKRHRDDAFSEAWVAFKLGRDPINAANTYARKERRIELRQTPISTDDDGNPSVADPNANDPSDLSDPLGPIET